MPTYTRKEFLGLSALLTGGVGCSGLPGTEAQETGAGGGRQPDLALVNGRVYTIDDAAPQAEAFALTHGRFITVGSTDDIRNLVGPNTEVIDAEGMTVTPGFIDTHCHPSGVNELYGVNTAHGGRDPGCPSGEGGRDPARLLGHRFHVRRHEGGRRAAPPTHLDEAVPDHPVNVAHRGGHTNWYNSAAFALAGITRDTPDPPDGRFNRDADGELAGMVAENARRVFDDVGRRDELTPDQRRERAREGMAHISTLLTAAGLTTVHDAGASRGKLVAYQDTYQAGELRHRAYIMIRGAYQALRNAGISTGFGDEWVRIGGVKYAADGSASERTMRMSTPFEGRPDDYGILTMSQEEIHEVVEDAHRNNWQVGIHANGDVTIRATDGDSEHGARKDFDGQVWGGNQRVTVDEALRIATIPGARASYEEHVKGSIAAGKLADFVVLERDPHEVDPDDIKNIAIVRTVVGGRTVYPATT